MLTLDAVFFWAGLAFFDTETVLPVLLSRLGASDPLVGFARFLQLVGFTFPALFSAHAIHGLRYHKSFLLRTLLVGRTGLLIIPPALITLSPHRPGTMLALFYFLYGIFWLLDGYAAVSWFDIVAKSIPESIRGRFFGLMQLTGGIAAIGAGLIVKVVLQDARLPFPNNFALLATFWCVGVAGSQIFLMMIREPDGTAAAISDKPSFREYLRQAMPLLRGRRQLRLLILSRLVHAQKTARR